MTDKRFDLAVLGGGNAVAVAIRAANAGRRVALIEKDRLGGTCPNRGCVPSKLLIGYADVAATIREAGRFFIDAALESVDRDRVLRETRAATFDVTDTKIAANLPAGVELLRGHGRFVGPHSIAVGDRRIDADAIVIATGTRPRRADDGVLADLPYWTSDDVFELDRAPESIAIVGGGYIACELAHVFASLGVRTVQVVRSNDLVKTEDRDVRRVFREGYAARIDVRFNASIVAARHDGSGFRLDVDGPSGGSIEVERVLYAIGRVPNTDDIGLDAVGVRLGRHDFIATDDHLRTSAPGVYALGDVKGGHLFTHAAAFEANYLGDVLLNGKTDPLDYGPMPHAVFSRPEIAGVGATEDELQAAGTPYLAASLPYSTAAKGRAVKEQHGLCKFLLAPTGAILGCHIVGHEASVLLHEVIPVMRWRNHISSLTEIIHVHPSLSEVVRNTARKAAALL